MPNTPHPIRDELTGIALFIGVNLGRVHRQPLHSQP